MSASTEKREAIRRITDAAGRVADDKTIVKPLIASTGLSREGVQHALIHCLETYPCDEEIESMVARAPTANRVHVILSANVFTAPLRAIAWARATAPKVSVSVSSREPVFAGALLEAIADPAIFVADRDAIDQLEAGDEIHVYGRAETIDAVRARAPAGVIVRAHGPGFGVAFLSLSDRPSASERLAADIVAFDQRGCLSPRVIFFDDDEDPTTQTAILASIQVALENTKIPRGELAASEKEDVRRYIETMRVVGAVDVAANSVVGFAPTIILPPPGRHVHCVPVRDWREIPNLLGEMARFVTIVGADDPGIAAMMVPQNVRVAALGSMQNPPFDGPVDLRVI